MHNESNINLGIKNIAYHAVGCVQLECDNSVGLGNIGAMVVDHNRSLNRSHIFLINLFIALLGSS